MLELVLFKSMLEDIVEGSDGFFEKMYLLIHFDKL